MKRWQILVIGVSILIVASVGYLFLPFYFATSQNPGYAEVEVNVTPPVESVLIDESGTETNDSGLPQEQNHTVKVIIPENSAYQTFNITIHDESRQAQPGDTVVFEEVDRAANIDVTARLDGFRYSFRYTGEYDIESGMWLSENLEREVG